MRTEVRRPAVMDHDLLERRKYTDRVHRLPLSNLFIGIKATVDVAKEEETILAAGENRCL